MTVPHRRRTGRSPARWLSVGASAALLATLAPGGAFTLTSAASASADEVTDCASVPWMDQTKTPDQRATALLAASSQHQKYRWLVEQPANSPQQTTFGGVEYPVQVDCTPTVVYVDGPEGVRAGTGVTTYPGQLSLASTWSTDLATTKGAQMAAEAFGKRKNVILGPGISGGRTPLAGRTPEYFGEDPVLSGVLAGAQARGIESDDTVLSDLKHYIANEQETDRQTSSSNVGEQAFKQLYELPFAIASDEGDPESVMCSYNQVNGIYACENPILQTSLKDQVGFDGYVMSDFGSVHSTAASLNAGMDQELNRPIWFTPEKLDAALAAGEITQARIDQAAFRVVRSYIRGGLFDHPLPATAAADVSTTAHKATARRISEQGSVLLKNDGLLPLAPTDGQTIAVIGTTAAKTTTEGKSATKVCSMEISAFFGTFNTMACEDLVAPLDALTARAALDGTDVVYDPGTDPAHAAAVAADADYVVVFGYEQSAEFSDPTDLQLDGNGDALISAVAAANPKTVVVLQTGTAVLMPWLDDVSGVLENWYGGEQMGPAIARLLFGDVNPTGKLPMTFPRSEEQLPTSTDAQYPGLVDGSVVRPEGNTSIRQVDYTEGLEVGYRWYQAHHQKPLFPFGYGLTYTKFRYSDVAVSLKGSKRPQLSVTFRLTNRGTRAGTDLAQVYADLPAKTGEPAARLIGWTRVSLAPGQTRKVTLHLDAKTLERRHLLQYWSTSADAWRTPTGTVRVSVGGSSDASRSAAFTLK